LFAGLAWYFQDKTGSKDAEGEKGEVLLFVNIDNPADNNPFLPLCASASLRLCVMNCRLIAPWRRREVFLVRQRAEAVALNVAEAGEA